jgi:hypothetical protein
MGRGLPSPMSSHTGRWSTEIPTEHICHSRCCTHSNNIMAWHGTPLQPKRRLPCWGQGMSPRDHASEAKAPANTPSTHIEATTGPALQPKWRCSKDDSHVCRYDPAAKAFKHLQAQPVTHTRSVPEQGHLLAMDGELTVCGHTSLQANSCFLHTLESACILTT